MAMAEVAILPDDTVPIVNIFGSKMVFRPFIYFKKLDVMLTTPNVIPIRPDTESLNMLGLLILFSMFQFHKPHYISFNMEEMSQLHKTGWRDALTAGKNNQQNSEVYIPRELMGVPHTNAQVHMHSSSESETDDNSEIP